MQHEAVDDDHSAASGSNGPPIKLLLLLVVVIATAIFFFQNGQDADVDFLWMDGRWPIWMVIGISLAAGIVIDRLVTWQWRRARRRKQSEQD